MASPITPEATEELLRRHKITPPSNKHGEAGRLEGGYEIAIGGHRREDGRKMVTVTIGNISESRPCPFQDGEARDIVRRFCDQHNLPKRPALDRMLEHLLNRADQLYASDRIESFALEKIQLHSSGYRIGSAQILATKPLKVPRANPRLGRNREGLNI